MKINHIQLAILCFVGLYNNINTMNPTDVDQREQLRSRLIRIIELPIIESDKPSSFHLEKLQRNLTKFLNKYPFYASYNTAFFQNLTLYEFLSFHGKQNCFPHELATQSQPETMHTSRNDIDTSTTASLSTAGTSPTQSEGTSFPTPKKFLSRHGCGNTNLTCAFTCKY